VAKVTRDVEAHVSEHIHQGRAAKRVVIAIGGTESQLVGVTVA
jgi:hypothetical protein